MSAVVLVIVPGIGPLALAPEALREAQARGATLLPSPDTPAPPPVGVTLVSPADLAARTGVPARWWLDQARDHRVPHHRIGRRVRFVLDEVLGCDAARRRGMVSDTDEATPSSAAIVSLLD